MNTSALNFLTSDESDAIVGDVAALMDDTDVSRAITYRDFVSMTRTPSTGASTPSYTNYTIRGVRTDLSAREVAAGAGLYQIGDIEYIFAQSDLPIVPHREDRIFDDPYTYEVIHWASDPLSVKHHIIARRVK